MQVAVPLAADRPTGVVARARGALPSLQDEAAPDALRAEGGMPGQPSLPVDASSAEVRLPEEDARAPSPKAAGQGRE